MPARRFSSHPSGRFACGLLLGLVALALVGCGPKTKEPELKPEPVLTQPEPEKPHWRVSSKSHSRYRRWASSILDGRLL